MTDDRLNERTCFEVLEKYFLLFGYFRSEFTKSDHAFMQAGVYAYPLQSGKQ